MEIYGNWRSHLIGNERLVSVVAKANRGDEITPEEDIQLANLMDDLCVALASSQPAAQSISLYGSSAEIDYLEYVLDQNPGLAPYLPRIHRYLSGAVPDFAKAMEPLMARRGVGTS